MKSAQNRKQLPSCPRNGQRVAAGGDAIPIRRPVCLRLLASLSLLLYIKHFLLQPVDLNAVVLDHTVDFVQTAHHLSILLTIDVAVQVARRSLLFLYGLLTIFLPQILSLLLLSLMCSDWIQFLLPLLLLNLFDELLHRRL